MWRHEVRLLTDELLADTGAFLLGHYAERLERQSVVVPVWAWTNLLAHGTEDELRAEMACTRCGSVGSGAWRAARAYLATEVLEAAGRESTLPELQRQVLVPLELSLATRSEVQRWNRQQWVAAVRSALGERRHSRRA